MAQVALSARLDLRQGQSLVITPQLQQAIKLLQLSNLELDAFIEGEIEKNPLLARDERDGAPEHEGAPDEPRAVSDSFDEAPGGANAADMDVRHDDLYADASPGDRATGDAGEAAPVSQTEGADPAGDGGGAVDWSRANKGGSFDTDGEGFESSASREKTLYEHLEDQASLANFSPADRAVASALIGRWTRAGIFART